MDTQNKVVPLLCIKIPINNLSLQLDFGRIYHAPHKRTTKLQKSDQKRMGNGLYYQSFTRFFTEILFFS